MEEQQHPKQHSSNYKDEGNLQRLRAFGRLGGRPKKDRTRSRTVSVRVDEEEFKKIVADFEESSVVRISDFYRLRLLNKNIEESYDSVRIHRELSVIRSNFSRLSNYMKRDIFNQEEKAYFLEQLSDIMQQVRALVRW